MPVTAVRLVRSRNAAGDVVVRLGVRLLDEYLEFLAGRCRPNTVLAVAYDLKVFFAAVKKPPRWVRPADVLAFMTAQRTGGEGRLQVAGPGAAGVSARTLRRRPGSPLVPPGRCSTSLRRRRRALTPRGRRRPRRDARCPSPSDPDTRTSARAR